MWIEANLTVVFEFARTPFRVSVSLWKICGARKRIEQIFFAPKYLYMIAYLSKNNFLHFFLSVHDEV